MRLVAKFSLNHNTVSVLSSVTGKTGYDKRTICYCSRRIVNTTSQNKTGTFKTAIYLEGSTKPETNKPNSRTGNSDWKGPLT